MATEQVLNWIGGTVTPHNQAPLKLSRNIDSFETDFANGYLFGEILSQYGLGAPLSSFSKRDTKEAKVHNFYMIETSLRQLRVSFDAKLMHQIMNEERGASLRLLYQIKLAVDKHFSETKTTVTGLRPTVVDKKVKMVADLATKLPHIGKKEYGIEGSSIAPGKNFKVVEDKLLKYELAHHQLKDRARKGDLEEKNMLQSMQQEKRQEAMKKLKENQDFMKTWEKKGREDWRKNRQTRAHEIQRALEFDDREVRIYKDRLERELKFNSNDMHEGIEAFHENMQKLGIEQNISIAEAMRRMDEKKGIPPGQIQNFSYAATMNKIKETKNNNEFAGKERERRNRKMLVDQRAIQEQLDIKKHEESLIQKLLEKQATEQKVAMNIQRQRKCQQLVFQNRKKKQDTQALIKVRLNEALDQKMRRDAEEKEGERRDAHDQVKQQYYEQRKAEKRKKRALNIEIASEIFDLIMDVAEVAADKMEAAEAEAAQRREAGEEEDSDELEERLLIQKPTWRHWMDIFTEGKKVSEENLVIEEDDPMQQTKGQGLDSMSMLLSTSATSTVTPYKLMTEIRGEPVFSELLQYVCQTGPLNLRLVATDKWICFRDVLLGTRQTAGGASGQSGTSTPRQLSERSVDSADFLNGVYLPKNVELGRFINRMYNGPGSALMASSSLEDAGLTPAITALAGTNRSVTAQAISEENQAMGAPADGGNVTVGSHIIDKRAQDAITVINQSAVEANIFKPDFPAYHSIKLALLGGSFAGKRTIAASMKQKMGDSITLFNMNEILREALVYVDPNSQKEEVVDPKAKGKGKGAPEAPVDIFAGKDTTKYKEVAAALLKQVQLTTGNETALPDKKTDLLQLVSDDDLLVQLFTQKLKLTYPAQGTSAEERDATLQARMTKETELIEQLEEAKQNEGAEVDPKGKGKPKAVKSVQEVQDELKALLSFEKKGWILLDFPRNLTQAKLLEKAFTGFQTISDRPKAAAFESFEVWTKFTDPDGAAMDSYEGEIEAQPSLFDCVVMLDASKDECLRRARNRKMDPTSQTVYHAEDSPAPEGDAKLLERLVDYYGEFSSAEDMAEKLSSAHDRFSTYQPVLKEFYSTFGQFDKIEKQGFETLKCAKIEQGNTREAVQRNINQLLDKIFAFKQIEEDRVFAEFKHKVKAEEERARLEAEAAPADDVSGAPSGDKSARDGNKSTNGANEKQTIDSNLPVDKSIKGNTPMAAATNMGGLAEQQLSKTSIHSKMSMSQSGVDGKTLSRSRKKNRVEYTKSYIIKLWEDMEVNYLKDGVMSLSDIKRQRLSVTDNLNNCQRQFIEFLERPCEKQDKVNEFVQSFNQFSSQYPDLRKDDQTKDELSSRLERLANALWDITDRRKEESLERIANMSKSGWSNQEMRQVVRNMASLVEIEIKKISTVYQIVMQHETPVELDAEIFAKKLLERGVLPFDETKGTSPALEQVFSNLLTKVNELLYKNTAVLPVLNEEQGIILRNEKNVLTYRLAQIYAWALVILEEIHVNSRQVYDRLDDWIVDAVAQENYISQDVVTFIKDAISNEVMFIDDFQAQMQPIELFSKLEVIQYRSDETPLYMRNIVVPNEQVETTRFTVPQLRTLYKEARQNSGGLGHGAIVEANTFVNMLVLAVRHGRVPLCWRYHDFERIMQLVRKFEVTPLKSPRGANQQLSFLAQTHTAASSQCWVDWKRALIAFALLRTDVPNEQTILQLQEQLGGADACVSKDNFVKTTLWFDAVEGQPEAALYAQWMTAKRAQMQEEEYDSELDDAEVSAELKGKVDTERLSELKALIFDLYRAPTGEEKLCVADMVAALRPYCSTAATPCSFNQFLFHD